MHDMKKVEEIIEQVKAAADAADSLVSKPEDVGFRIGRWRIGHDPDLGSYVESELRREIARLDRAVHLLLPPRGPATSLDCPHCGKSVTVVLGK
jgi:hypothetical protein